MDQSLVVNLNQAAINGVSVARATSQYITVEGNNRTVAWAWTSGKNGATIGALTDPQNKIIYQMHQYLGGDGSGTSATCVSSTIGQDRIPAATQWPKSNGKLGIIGEFAGGTNSRCETAAQVTWTQTQTSGLALCGGLLGHNGPINLPVGLPTTHTWIFSISAKKRVFKCGN